MCTFHIAVDLPLREDVRIRSHGANYVPHTAHKHGLRRSHAASMPNPGACDGVKLDLVRALLTRALARWPTSFSAMPVKVAPPWQGVTVEAKRPAIIAQPMPSIHRPIGSASRRLLYTTTPV